MADTIEIFKSVDELARFFSLKFAAQVMDTPDGEFCAVALSGGSTPKVIFEYLASHFKEVTDWEKVKLFWSDERCVVPESDESNFKMADESLVDLIPIPASNIFRIRGEADPRVEAERYENLVRDHVPSVAGIPRFDMMMLGIGDDGHTASIFPENIHLFHSDNLFEASEHPGTGQKRVTATGKLINHAKNIMFLVTGASKAEIVEQILEKKTGTEKYPASLVHAENGQLMWLLDEPAASKLSKK